MKNKKKLFYLILNITCLSGLLLFPSSSLAVYQCDEVETVLTLGDETETWSSHGNDGSKTRELGQFANDNYVCFPTSIRFNNVDGDTEFVSCKVYLDELSQQWILEANSVSGHESLDDDAECRAQCFKWDNQ